MSEEKTVLKTEKAGKVAIVLVRGTVGVKRGIKDTLAMLRLNNKNYCVVVENTPNIMGMIKKVKDYVTWGVISEETFKELVEKRGEEYGGRLSDSKGKYSYKTLDVDGKKYKPYFRLNPPRKGFGRKGIKMAFKVGGALGDRGEKMNDLLKRMI
jgi:large subunit ribosomal protein L30